MNTVLEFFVVRYIISDHATLNTRCIPPPTDLAICFLLILSEYSSESSYIKSIEDRRIKRRETRSGSYFVASANETASSRAAPRCCTGCRCNGTDVEEEVELFRILNTKLRVE